MPSDCGLWIGELNSGEVTQITSNTDPPCDREYIPHWSPDGAQLTYWRDPYENGQPTGTAVYVINADGTNEQRLTDPAMFAGSPDWSPDGEWIVFDTYPLHEFQCCQVSNLYRMHPDGSGMEQLTHYETEDLRATQPRYTPDGAWIVFTAVDAKRPAACGPSRPRGVSRSSSPRAASTRTAPGSRLLPRREPSRADRGAAYRNHAGHAERGTYPHGTPVSRSAAVRAQ